MVPIVSITGSSASRWRVRAIQPISSPTRSAWKASNIASTTSRSLASPRRRLPIASVIEAETVAGDVLGQRLVQAGDAAEMMKQVGVGPADPGRNRLQRHRRYALVAQQLARRRHRRGAAFVRRQAFADLQTY